MTDRFAVANRCYCGAYALLSAALFLAYTDQPKLASCTVGVFAIAMTLGWCLLPEGRGGEDCGV